MVCDLPKVSELMSEGWETEEVPVFRTQTFIFIFCFFEEMFTV